MKVVTLHCAGDRIPFGIFICNSMIDNDGDLIIHTDEFTINIRHDEYDFYYIYDYDDLADQTQLVDLIKVFVKDIALD